MSSQTRTIQFGRRLWRRSLTGAGIAALAVVMAGCDDSGQFSMPTFGAKTGTETSAATPTGPVVERDIEAPEVFSVTDEGLWDGRPSLGGVWVAHPDVDDPERVIIRNQTNGKFVVGALFRRERDIPGPSLQISSDAAEALGILAGAPAKLNVTALRRVEQAAEVPVAQSDDVPTVEAAAPVATAPLDPVTETTGAAIDAVAPTPPPAVPPVQKSSIDKPFIQIGIFSVEANAERAAKQMRSAGLIPSLKQSQINGKTFWRVVVGPAATASERSKLLSTIKAEGFTDAYAVSS